MHLYGWIKAMILASRCSVSWQLMFGYLNPILFRFLWRKNASFAISRHYRRFDVFVEAEANKAAAKYDNASIDFQVEFYKSEGLTPYSEAKLPITSGRSKIILLFVFIRFYLFHLSFSFLVSCWVCRCAWRVRDCKGTHSY